MIKQKELLALQGQLKESSDIRCIESVKLSVNDVINTYCACGNADNRVGFNGEIRLFCSE